jgi:hypothetical protein
VLGMTVVKRLDAWLAARVTWVALAVVVAAGALRLFYALETYLNPDEALHFLGAHTNGVLAAYRRSLSTAHPPLFLLVLHGVLDVSTSELAMRLPSLVCGTLALWFAFRWLQRAGGAAVALAGLVLLACAPGMISAATEVRQYGLLLLGVCAALYCMERFMSERSVAWVAAYAAALYLAILSHYTAACVVLALGLYVPLRLWLEHAPVRLGVAWALSQAGVVALYTWLYATHLYRLRGGGMEETAISGWLKYSYYRPGEEPALAFAVRALDSTFRYAGGGPLLGALTLVLFVAGLLAIAARWPRAETPVRRDYVVLLVLPSLIGCAAALGRWLPFGESRHVSYLLPFIAAGVAVAGVRLLRSRLSVVLLAGAVLAGLWLRYTAPANSMVRMARVNMTAALAYLQAAVPKGSVLFVDRETHNVLAYYLDRDEKDLRLPIEVAVAETRLGGYRVVSIPQRWRFNEADFVADLDATSTALDLRPGEPVWVMAVGWGDQRRFESRVPANALLIRKPFGTITLLQTAVGYVGR